MLQMEKKISKLNIFAIQKNRILMSDNKSVNSFILQVGALLGVTFSAIIYIAHLRGMNHMPGDNIAWLNMIVFVFVVTVSARQYRENAEGEGFTYQRAFIYINKLNIISAVILSVFGYFYYKSIAPGDIQFIIDQAETMFAERGMMSNEQTEALLQIYRQTISGGTMAFVMLMFQLAGGAFFSLFLANGVKWRKRIIIS